MRMSFNNEEEGQLLLDKLIKDKAEENNLGSDQLMSVHNAIDHEEIETKHPVFKDEKGIIQFVKEKNENGFNQFQDENEKIFPNYHTKIETKHSVFKDESNVIPFVKKNPDENALNVFEDVRNTKPVDGDYREEIKTKTLVYEGEESRNIKLELMPVVAIKREMKIEAMVEFESKIIDDKSLKQNTKIEKCESVSQPSGQMYKEEMEAKMKELEIIFNQHKGKFTCKLCKKTFSTVVRKEHLMVHLKIKPFICKDCGTGFTQKCHLESHSLLHTNIKAYQCKVCKVSFRHPCSLKKHTNTRHWNLNSSKRPLYICDQCNKPFASKRNLQIHQLIHLNLRQFSCYVCGNSFTQRGNLINHIALHGDERPYPCTECDRRFKTKKDHSRHMVKHLQIYNYKCNECGEEFKYRNRLKAHLTKHTNLKEFCCDICGSEFKLKSCFKSHLLTHEQLNKFCCDSCDKRFNSLGRLRTHKLLTHSTESYICSECGKSFAAKTYLRIHMNVHSSSTPFSCSVCNQSYKSKLALRNHTILKKHYT